MYYCASYTKMYLFGIILSKRGYIDSFHKYLLNTYNAPGYWARTEHSMVNKNRHSPCFHGARGWVSQKDVNQEFPQINISLQTEISALKAKKLGGWTKAERLPLKLSTQVQEKLDVSSCTGISWELRPEHTGKTDIQRPEWLVDEEPGEERTR